MRVEKYLLAAALVAFPLSGCEKTAVAAPVPEAKSDQIDTEYKDPWDAIIQVDGQRFEVGGILYRGMRTIEGDAFGPGGQWRASKGGKYVVFEYDITNTSNRQVSVESLAWPRLWTPPGPDYVADPKLTVAFRQDHPTYGANPDLVGPGMTITTAVLFEVPEDYMRKFWVWTMDGKRYASIPLDMTREEAEQVAATADERRQAGGPENDFRRPGPGDSPENCGSAGCPNY